MGLHGLGPMLKLELVAQHELKLALDPNPINVDGVSVV